MLLNNYTNQLRHFLSGAVRGTRARGYALAVTVAPDTLVGVLSFLKRSTFAQLKSLMGIACYDRPGKGLRFVLVYTLLSTHFSARFFLSIGVP
jgi:NADH:ubiquinone oxidoreductase subunit C